MAIDTNVNYPLLNDLVAMGILTSKSSPKQVGPFKIKTECFAGDSSGGTKVLAEALISGGVHSVLSLNTDGTANNTFASLDEGTHFTTSTTDGTTTLTWITDQSGKQIMIQYAY